MSPGDQPLRSAAIFWSGVTALAMVTLGYSVPLYIPLVPLLSLRLRIPGNQQQRSLCTANADPIRLPKKATAFFTKIHEGGEGINRSALSMATE